MSKFLVLTAIFLYHNNVISQDTTIINLSSDFRYVIIKSDLDSTIYKEKMNQGIWLKDGHYKLFTNGKLVELMQFNKNMLNGKYLRMQDDDTVFNANYKRNILQGKCSGKFIHKSGISEPIHFFSFNGFYKKGNRIGKWIYQSDSLSVMGHYSGKSFHVNFQSKDSVVVSTFPDFSSKFIFNNYDELFNLFEKHGYQSIGTELNIRKGKWQYYINNEKSCVDRYNKKGYLIKRRFFNLYNDEILYDSFFFLNNR